MIIISYVRKYLLKHLLLFNFQSKMVRVYKRRTNRGQAYTKTVLERAIEDINNGLISAYAASKKYNIPQMTLSYHRRGLRGKKSKTMGRSTAIPFEEEEKLAQGLITMEKWGWGLSRRDVLTVVQEYINKNGLRTSFKNGRPGEDWFLAFRRRHKLSIKKPQSVEFARKRCMDPFIINDYFQKLGKLLDDLDLRDKPEQVWNLDETNFALDPSKTKVVGKKGAPSSRTTAGSGKENITVLVAVNAAGFKAPPLIVFKGKNIWSEWVAPPDESYPGTTYAATANGWMESEVFLRYFKNPLLEAFGPRRPILLIYDGHVSHVDIRLIMAAIEHEVTILKLPPHSSHLLQPLDLCVFKSLKTKWDYNLTQWQRTHEGQKIPKKIFSKLVSDIWKELRPEVICSGFRKGGIVPFNPDIIEKEQYDPLAYQRWEHHQRQIREVNAVEGQRESILQEPIAGPSTSEESLPAPSTEEEPRPEIIPKKNGEDKKYTFEELLLATVKQSKSGDVSKPKRKIVSGAEVITAQEVLIRLEEKNTKALPGKKKKKSKKDLHVTAEVESESSSENEDVILHDNSDEDFGEEITENESLNEYMNDIQKDKKDAIVNDWVLVVFATKNKNKHYYIGQIIAINEDDELEVKFTRKVPSLNPSSPSTFAWANPEDCSTVARNDVVRVLPTPSVCGRRGLLRFQISFLGYNIG